MKILALVFIISISISTFGQDRGYIVKVGDKAPELEMTLTDGSTINTKDLLGDVVVLQFTASWCGVCRREMPYLEKDVHQVFKDKGVHLIGVDYNEPIETVEQFAKSTRVTYPLALDPGGQIFKMFALPNSGVTRNVVIDQQGNIAFLTRLFNHEEFNEMVSKIKELTSSN